LAGAQEDGHMPRRGPGSGRVGGQLAGHGD
jgi:hypothetical protein